MTESTQDSKFNVVFNGRLVIGRNAAEVEATFAHRFGASIAERVFNSESITLKSDIDRQQALKLQRVLEDIGMSVVLQPIAPTDTDLTLSEPFLRPTEQPHVEPPLPATPPDAESFGELPQRPPVAATRKGGKNTYKTSELDNAFKGSGAHPPTSRMYGITLLPVTFLMLLLPAIYVGITAFSIYGAYWIATRGFSWFLGLNGSIYLHFLGYSASMMAAVLLALFLLRPLVAKIEKGPQPVRVDAKREPVLFHLVDRISAAIGAPMPEEILVDTDVNASARLTRGVFSNTLTLTIGLPLLYGTNVETVAGILAHEFGHFTQRWGMRASHLIHGINYWFYRQVHERDSWDSFVEKMLEQDFVVFQFGAILAQIGSFLVRLLLTVLGMLAGLFSFSLSRQMEFDADRFQIALLGSARYGETAENVRILAVGHELAVRDLSAALDGDKKVDNLPRLAAIKTAKLSESDRKRIVDSIEEVNTSVFDTHPTDRARLRKALEADLPPQFTLDGPAEKLLCEIDRLSQLATLQWYRSHGIDIVPSEMTPLADIEADVDAFDKAKQFREHFFGAIERLPQKFRLPPQANLSQHTDEKLLETLNALTAAVRGREADFATARQELDLHLEYQYYYGQARFWRREGFDIDLNAYRLKLTTADLASIEKILSEHKDAEKRLVSELDDLANLQGQRLSLALQLSLRRGHVSRTGLDALLLAYSKLAAVDKDVERLIESNIQLALLIQINADLPNQSKYLNRQKSEKVAIQQVQDRLRTELRAIPDPLAKNATLADSLPPEDNALGPRSPEVILDDAGRLVRQLQKLGTALEGRMSEIALAHLR